MTAPSLIRDARRFAGISQQQLADRIGTTQSAVSRWERGHDEPRIRTLSQILTACGLRLVMAAEPDEVDRAQIRQQLAMTPQQRLAGVTNFSRMLASAERLD